MMDRLYEKLLQYSKLDYYPMHMPGHKQNGKLMSMINPYEIDITEIEGFDNLHQAEGVLKQLSLRLRNLYQAEKSYPLVNGSTAGILAGISAATAKRDQILVARNCHKSVYHGILLRELRPYYLYPERIAGTPVQGGILPTAVEDVLASHPGIRLVVITSPTYEGVVSDIAAIAKVTHRHGALLLVDEAHGAHFGFHKAFPESAVKLGADLVIQSLHKTLPSFTQTAILHCNHKPLEHKLEQYLEVFQSSSPSYLLMAGIDRCVSLLEEKSGEMFEAFHIRLEEFYRSMETLHQLQLMNRSVIGSGGVYELDPSKLTIMVGASGLTGQKLSTRLREEYHIVVEMAAREYILAMTSICDTDEGFTRFEVALSELDRETDDRGKTDSISSDPEIVKQVQVMPPFEAMEQVAETVMLSESKGRVSAAFVSIYPPGIPLLVPGERIDELFLQYIDFARREGLNVTGLINDGKDQIEVIC